MNRIYTVRLVDGTVGTINNNTLDGQSASDFIGEVINVHVFSEDGPIEVEGRLVEVIGEETEY